MPNPQRVPPTVVENVTDRLDTRLAYDGSGNTEYVGYAPPGSATNADVWGIKKLGYSAGVLVSVLWANRAQFNLSWDNRAAYTYGP